MLSISELSAETGIASHTLRRLTNAGKITVTFTDGGHRRYDEFQVEKALKYKKEKNFFPNARNVLDGKIKLKSFHAYLIGLIMADGTFQRKRQVVIEMKEEKLLRELGERLNVEVHKRPNKSMFRMTVPARVRDVLFVKGMKRKKNEGFEVPLMNRCSFGHFLRGLFDGDGSVSVRGSGVVLRFHGHHWPMGDVQKTLYEGEDVYFHWVDDKRSISGMLERGKRESVRKIFSYMYKDAEIFLERKKEQLEKCF